MSFWKRTALVGTVVVGTMLVASTRSEAQGDPAGPTLNAEQQAKLKAIQAKFNPGGTVSSNSYGIDKAAEFCGASIPLEVHPSTVANEDPKKSVERSEVPGICNAVAGAVVYTCDYSEERGDPVIKEMIRNNVKRVVCKSTKNADDVDQYKFQKWGFENGTLTFTYLSSRSPGNVIEEGEKFLKKNIHRAGPNSLSIGGQQIKRKMINDLSLKKWDLRKYVKDEHGIDITVAVDDDRLPEHYSQYLGYNPGSACEAGLQVVYNTLRGAGEEDRTPAGLALKAAVKKNLKGISCVYSENESIEIKPGGIIELGHSRYAQRPKWEGRSMMSIHDYYTNYLQANASKLSAEPAPAPAPKKPAPPPAKKLRTR